MMEDFCYECNSLLMENFFHFIENQEGFTFPTYSMIKLLDKHTHSLSCCTYWFTYSACLVEQMANIFKIIHYNLGGILPENSGNLMMKYWIPRL